MSKLSIAAIERAISEKPISTLQFRVGAMCALLLIFDGYDIGAISYVIPPIASSWGALPVDFTLAIVLGGVGMLLGSLISGPLSDLIGRKPVLMLCLAAFGVFSLASAFSTTVTLLTITRFLTGLGLGGGLPAAIALTADYCPRRHQIILVGVMTGAIPIGLIIGGFLSSVLIPHYGWQSVFIFGGVLPLLMVPLLAVAMPESVQFLITRHQADEKAIRILQRLKIDITQLDAQTEDPIRLNAAHNPIRSLFRPRYAKRTLLLWCMFFCNLLGSWLVIFWLPTILTAAGVSSGNAAFYSALLPLGGLLGIGMIALLVRKINTEIALACALLLGGAAIFAMWYWEMTINLTSLLIFLSGMGLMGAQFGLNGLSGSVYPSDIRATGSGWALGVGRVGNIVGPGLGGLVLGLGFATKTMFLVAVVPTLIAALALLLLARERLAGRLDPASVEY